MIPEATRRVTNAWSPSCGVLDVTDPAWLRFSLSSSIMAEIRTIQECLAAVCQMPVELHRRGDISILRLAEESDYRAHQTAIEVDDIQQYLESHPELVGNWYVYSDNNRTSSGWYFDHAGCRVGYFSGSRREREQKFDTVTQACAAFIKHEMDSITGHAA